MSKSERCRQPALGAIDQYEEMEPILRHVRVMEAVMTAVQDHPKMRDFYSELYGVYMGILNREIAEHALELALALKQLEAAYPEIGKPEPI